MYDPSDIYGWVQSKLYYDSKSSRRGGGSRMEQSRGVMSAGGYSRMSVANKINISQPTITERILFRN